MAHQSNESIWRELRKEFDDLRDLIETTRHETQEEAIERTYPEWNDPEIGMVRAWLLIPYRNDADAEWVEFWSNAASSLVPALDRMFEERTLSLEFVRTWGMFCRATAFVEAAYVSEPDEVTSRRAGIAGEKAVTKRAQRKWIAHLLNRLADAKFCRKKAEARIAALIRRILSNQEFSPGFDDEWFSSILDKRGDLKTTYQQEHLYRKHIHALLSEPTDDIPEVPDDLLDHKP